MNYVVKGDGRHPKPQATSSFDNVMVGKKISTAMLKITIAD